MIEGAEQEFLRSGNWLSPSWRPAGLAPTLFLVLASLSPWLFYLPRLGPRVLVAVATIVAISAVIGWRSRRRSVGP